MRPVSLHSAAWRYPGAWPDANFNFQHLKYFATRYAFPMFLYRTTRELRGNDPFFAIGPNVYLNLPSESLQETEKPIHTIA